MARSPVIADASALISLGWVDQLQVLPGLFGRIVVPPAVAAEATHRGSVLASWVDVRPLGRAPDARVAAAHLGAGESEAIGPGLDAVLVEAKRAGHLAQVRPTLDALLARGFRWDRRVYDRILKAAGEGRS